MSHSTAPEVFVGSFRTKVGGTSSGSYRAPEDDSILLERPSNVEPIFDEVKASRSLPPYNDALYRNFFGESRQHDSETFIPARPESFDDAYLEPTLTKNEHARLTALWYYTNGVQQDKQLLVRLNRIIGIVKQSFSWELGIIGILDANKYTRLATVNLPLAVLPRRECTCAHTVNQKPGTVLTLQDLPHDWRFRRSPHVELGGLASYAAAQIRLVRDGADDVVFGSLCVASMSVQDMLTEEQKTTLINAADLVAGELVAWKQSRRLQDRQAMQRILEKLHAVNVHDDITAIVVQHLQQHYRGASVDIVDSSDETFCVQPGFTVRLDAIQNGLWENTEVLTSLLEMVPVNLTESRQPVRAVVERIVGSQRLLVVSSIDMQSVFDETDVWFVSQCAQTVRIIEQERTLADALAARDRLLRSITHELRTPIHGILSSVELLEEDLEDSTSYPRANGISFPSWSKGSSLHSFLRIIRQSGTQLMTTVNSILRLNSSTDHSILPPVSEYDLRFLEEDVLGEVLTNYDEDQLHALSIQFQTKSTEANTMVAIHADLLKELMKCLVFNAISATSSGTVEVTSHLLLDAELLRIDVIDSGRGINQADYERIFKAFEKLDITSRGVGVGLDLATRMAARLGGKIVLVSSQLGKGSHFQVELPCLPASPRAPSLSRGISQKCRLHTSKYHLVGESAGDLHLLSHLEQHLLRQGVERTDVIQGSLIILSQFETSGKRLDEVFGTLVGPHLILYIASALQVEHVQQYLNEKRHSHLVFGVSGPLCTSRLNNLLENAESALENFRNGLREQQGDIEKDARDSPATSLPQPSFRTTPPPTPSCDSDDPLLSLYQPRPLRVLLVDDNNINLAVLKSFCKTRQITHDTATNGNKAVSAYVAGLVEEKDKHPFTLVLMDLQMPECDGVEAVKQIRQIEKQRKLAPSIIFMITGQDSAVDKVNSFDAGVDGFYVKPVSMKTLDQIITEYFPDRDGSTRRK